MKFHKTPELLGVAITVAAVFSTFSVGAISADPGAHRRRDSATSRITPTAWPARRPKARRPA